VRYASLFGESFILFLNQEILQPRLNPD
jgi:hypothetical protein